MTFDEVASMVEEIGYPSAYDHFAEGESPDPPFVVFLFPGTDNFKADGEVYQEITEVRIELYTNKKSPDVERKIEKVLKAHDIPWDKQEEWIADERLYEVYYDFDVFYDEDGEDDEQIENGEESTGQDGP